MIPKNRFITIRKTGILLFLLLCSGVVQCCSDTHQAIPPNGLDVPFHDTYSDKNQCMQVAMKSVIEYFLDEVYTVDELDSVTGRKRGKWTSVSQGVFGLYELGLEVEAYCAEKEPDFRARWGRDAEKIVKNLDMAVVNEYSEKAVNSGLMKGEKLPFNKIEKHIEAGHVLIMIVDLNVLLNGESRSYNGHSVVVTGFDEDYIFYHEPSNSAIWPKPHRKVSKELFIEAWDANGTDNCVIIVFGKREKAV
ncbi:C39 family peptidase [Thermodesulfobacteriota bacterium]